MARFRVLHLSDLHFGARANQVHFKDRFSPLRQRFFRPSTHNLDIADAVARIAWIEVKNLDLIVITGDLATTGGEDDLLAAFDYVEADAHRGWKTHRSTPTLRIADVAPITVLPGNHDRYDYETAKYVVVPGCGGKTFDRVFKDYWHGRRAQLAAVLTQPRSDGEKLAIIAADLTLTSRTDAEGTMGVWGQGRVYPEALDSLVALTDGTRQEYGPIGILWAIHFAPYYRGLNPQFRLLSEDKLIQTAIERDVSHILCGHTHQPRIYGSELNPPVAIHCAGTACECSSHHGNCFHIRDVVVVNGRITSIASTRFDWDERAGDFLRHEESLYAPS